MEEASVFTPAELGLAALLLTATTLNALVMKGYLSRDEAKGLIKGTHDHLYHAVDPALGRSSDVIRHYFRGADLDPWK